MKSIKRKITLVSVLSFAVVALGVSLILYSDFEKETAARYAFPTQASTTFETGSFFFDCDGEAIAYPGQHDGQVMELELGHDLVSPSIDIDVKNFVGTNYTAQDISYIVSINDGTNSNHVNYDFSINDVAVGSSDVSQPRTISGDNASTDTISLKFNRTNNNVGGDTINIKIKSLAPYEKEIVFQIRIILPEITVSFDAKGGTVSPETTEVRYLSTYGTGTGLTDGQLPIPTREGYYFNGWYGTGDDFSPSTYAVPGGLNSDVYDHFLNNWQADGYNSFSEAVSNYWYQYGSSPKEGRQARSGKVSADNYNYNYDNNEESKLYAMWVPTSRTVKVVSPTSNAQTINCSTAGGQTIINNSTSQTSSGTVNLLDEGGDYLSVTFSCSISAAGYKTYNTGNISVGSYNFIYNENNPSTPGTYTLSPSLTPETYTVSFDAAGGSVNPSSKQVTYLSNYGDLPTPTKTHFAFKGWYLNGTQITSSTTNVQTSNHTLTAQWESTERTLTLVSTATRSSDALYNDDRQILHCEHTNEPKRTILDDDMTVPTEGNTSLSGTIYYDDGPFKCSVTADGYEVKREESLSYDDTSAPSKTITLSPTAADISGSYSNEIASTAKTGTLTNTRSGWYLIELWGAFGGDGYHYEKKSYDGQCGADSGYVYGAVKLDHSQVLSYGLGGKGTYDKDGIESGGALGGGHSDYPSSFEGIAGGGGGYSVVYAGSEKNLNNKTITTSDIIALAGGGGGGGGSRYLGDLISKAGKGGRGGTMQSETISIENGVIFKGYDAEDIGYNVYGRGGSNTGGINPEHSTSKGNTAYSTAGSYLEGGSGAYHGGGGGAGLYGGSGGSQNGQTGKSQSGGGGGSSFLTNKFNMNYSAQKVINNLTTATTTRKCNDNYSITSNNPNNTVDGSGKKGGGYLRIVYLGKNL